MAVRPFVSRYAFAVFLLLNYLRHIASHFDDDPAIQLVFNWLFGGWVSLQLNRVIDYLPFKATGRGVGYRMLGPRDKGTNAVTA
jgi:hypothetical protein